MIERLKIYTKVKIISGEFKGKEGRIDQVDYEDAHFPYLVHYGDGWNWFAEYEVEECK